MVTRLPSRLHHTESGTTYSNPSRHTAGSTCFRRSLWFRRRLPALSFSYPQSVGPLLLFVSACAFLTHAGQTLLSPRNVGPATFSKTKALWFSIHMNCLRGTDIPPAAFLDASVHHIDDALRSSCTMAFCSCSSSCIFVGSSFLVTSLFSLSIFQLLSFLSGNLPSSNPSILPFIRPFSLLLFDSGLFLLTILCPNRYLEYPEHFRHRSALHHLQHLSVWAFLASSPYGPFFPSVASDQTPLQTSTSVCTSHTSVNSVKSKPFCLILTSSFCRQKVNVPFCVGVSSSQSCQIYTGNERLRHTAKQDVLPFSPVSL